jgi:hypothetical protein
VELVTGHVKLVTGYKKLVTGNVKLVTGHDKKWNFLKIGHKTNLSGWPWVCHDQTGHKSHKTQSYVIYFFSKVHICFSQLI